MKTFLSQLLNGESLSQQNAYNALLLIGKGEVNTSQIAAFLMAIQIKGITVDELLGFRAAMLELANQVNLSDFDAMDIVGTGGDGKNTFNISTTAAFVLAGAGQSVAKHGNHGVSSAVGSSTVLEKLGIQFSNDESALKQQLDKANICFFHAPLFHPAMRFAGPVRKELGIKTFFNILGPLLNPAKVNKIFTGVYHPTILPLYAGVLSQTTTHFGIVHSVDIYDEISLTDDFILVTPDGQQRLSPESIGFRRLLQTDLYGNENADESATTLLNILQNKGTTAQTAAVVANAAVALSIARSISIEDSISLAQESIESGKAYSCLKTLTTTH